MAKVTLFICSPLQVELRLLIELTDRPPTFCGGLSLWVEAAAFVFPDLALDNDPILPELSTAEQS